MNGLNSSSWVENRALDALGLDRVPKKQVRFPGQYIHESLDHSGEKPVHSFGCRIHRISTPFVIQGHSPFNLSSPRHLHACSKENPGLRPGKAKQHSDKVLEETLEENTPRSTSVDEVPPEGSEVRRRSIFIRELTKPQHTGGSGKGSAANTPLGFRA